MIAGLVHAPGWWLTYADSTGTVRTTPVVGFNPESAFIVDRARQAVRRVDVLQPPDYLHTTLWHESSGTQEGAERVIARMMTGKGPR